jgi:uncharacterized protein (DUF1810 family)
MHTTRDVYDLERFVTAQAGDFEQACQEIRQKRKTGHWMWYVFPQLAGLGMSGMSQKYAISSLAEARAYLAHPTLGPRMKKACTLLLGIKDRSMSEVFGYPDDLKLRSSMTLFAIATPENPEFQQIISDHFEGQRDRKTLDLLRINPEAATPAHSPT